MAVLEREEKSTHTMARSLLKGDTRAVGCRDQVTTHQALGHLLYAGYVTEKVFLGQDWDCEACDSQEKLSAERGVWA